MKQQIGLQALRWRLWACVAFGGGCALFFALPASPPLWASLGPAVVLFVVWRGLRHQGARRIVTWPTMMAFCLALGLVFASVRTLAVDAPIAPALETPVWVEGWVIDVDSPGANGARVMLAPVRVEGLAPEQTPVRLRATLREAPPPPGTAVRLYGLLNPPPAPASPGAYDYARNAYFQGIGGVVFSLSGSREADLAPPPWRIRALMAVNAARYALAQRIVARMGERTGGVAAAMVTSHEVWISPEVMDTMRNSGLAHILSVSGLHMAIVGGFVFFAVRLGLAAVPWLALRVPGKKVAAVAGLVAVGTYLVVSGAPPPAERAAITASIAFLAILMDRQAVTMHGLAVSAFIVLMIQPETVMTPGFQMSFAATAALVALVEIWPKATRELSVPLMIAIPQRLGTWLAAAVTASLVAGMATGPFAMQHFNRTALYGLLANMAVSPVADFMLMPALAVGAALEPFGLGGPFLIMANGGVELMLAIGNWTASLPGAVQVVSSAPAVALPVAFLGILFACLWNGPLRWVGLPFAAAVLLWPRPASPDLWIADGAVNAAIRLDDRVQVIRSDARAYAVDMWSRRHGLTVDARAADDWSCRRLSCAPVTQGPLALAWGKRELVPEQLEALCRSAEVVAVRSVVRALPDACSGRLVLDAVDFRQGGAVELWRTDTGWKALWTAEVRGDRPWSRVAPISDNDG